MTLSHAVCYVRMCTMALTFCFRKGPATNEPFFTERRTVYDLGDLSKPGVPVRTLELTQNFGSHHLTVYAAEFDPLPGDVTSYRWRDASGEPCATQMPNFCLTNIEKVHGHLRQYIESAKWSYFKALQTEKDELAWMTVSAAVRYAMRKRVGFLPSCPSPSTDIPRILLLPTR